MGAIQNAVNTGIGAIGSAIAIGSHLSQEKKQVTESKETNKMLEEQKQRQELKDELEFTEKGQELEKETAQTVDAFNENLQNQLNLENQMTGIHSTLNDKRLRTSKGGFMSQKALQEMQDKQNEITLQNQRLDKQIKMIDKKRDIYKQLGGNL